MERVKLEHTDNDGFSKILYSVAKGSLLSAPAKEIPVEGADEAALKGRPWTAYTLIRVEKGQNAVLLKGDRILSSCGRPGDYRIEAEEDISKAKAYGGRQSEGIVIRPKTPVFSKRLSGNLSMKVINNKYLLKNED